MAGPVAQYYANVGISVDNKGIRDVDAYLKKIEDRLKKAVTSQPLKVNARIDEQKFFKHVQGVLNRAGSASPFKIKNVTVDGAALSASLSKAFEAVKGRTWRLSVSAVLSRDSLAMMRQQIQAGIGNVYVNARRGATSASNRSGGTLGGMGGINRPRGAVAAERRASLTGRGDPSTMEFLMGKPDKSSLSAGNRRYVDAIAKNASPNLSMLAGGGGMTGLFAKGASTALGGIARIGSGGIMGRLGMMGGMALGGPVGGLIGGALGAIPGMAVSAVSSVASGLASVITAPFKLIGGAASLVTGAFYKVALAALPLVGSFMAINNAVQMRQQRGIALDSVATGLGSSGKAEHAWLANMANRDGMKIDTLMNPYTSFIASASPAVGLDMSRNIFEAFTQFGSTRGADDESMKRAMTAVSQMAGKGKVGA